MKKIYLLAFAVFGMAVTANAQINDDLESYPAGPLFGDYWGTWSGAAGAGEELEIVSTYAHSGSQSGLISDDGVQDVMLKLGNETDGEVTVAWWNYVPAGRTGYYNFQEDENTTTGIWAMNVYLNYNAENPGVAWLVDDQNPANVVAQFAYPEGEWFRLTHYIDLDTDMLSLFMNDVEVYNGPFFSAGNLGGVDFYSAPNVDDSNTNELYIDDVFFDYGFVGTEDFAVDTFAVYPNPVTDFLNIMTKTAVDQVTVYDILGKVVLSTQPQVISPKIDMSAFSSGAYLVKVTIGNTSKTVKVIK